MGAGIKAKTMTSLLILTGVVSTCARFKFVMQDLSGEHIFFFSVTGRDFSCD